jgi:starch synthase
VKPLKILYACSELAPFASAGGLGDVAAALPRALRAQGHDVRFAMPCYRVLPDSMRGEQFCMCMADLGAKSAWGAMRVSTVPQTDIPLYLIEHEGYFGRDQLYGYGGYEYSDNPERFCFFCLALLHGIAQTNWRPDIVHCHDWHTAPIPAYIKTRLAQTAAWHGMPTLFTIHNIAYQGRYKAHFLPYTGFGWDLFTPECLEFYGDLNLMKAAIAFASKINTVSPRYAEEIQTPEFGVGLSGFLRTRSNSLSGILNGVDYTVWSPEIDSHIPAQYSSKKLRKASLQAQLGLPVQDVPLFGMVTRFYWQKGVDLLLEALDRIMLHDVQVVVLGTGDPDLEQALSAAAKRHPGKMRVIVRFDTPLSHQIEAGADFFLMPSHFEPCGLSQLYSLAYGAVPIVRETGGLADSVRPLTPANVKKGLATGIVFQSRLPEALAEAVDQAISLYRDRKSFRAVRITGMNQDFSWDRSSQAYVRLYRQAMARP